jgi:hypothetical protein
MAAARFTIRLENPQQLTWPGPRNWNHTLISSCESLTTRITYVRSGLKVSRLNLWTLIYCIHKRPPWSRGNIPTSWPGGGRRIFKEGKIQGTSPPGGTLSRLTRVVYLLHVKEPQAPRGPLSKITSHFPSKYIVSNSSGRWFRRSLVGGASGTIVLRGYGGWFEIQKGTYSRSYRGRGAWGNKPLKYHTILYPQEREVNPIQQFSRFL